MTLKDFNMVLPVGSRCLLVGDNGAGKTTLLRILGGKHLHDRDAVKVMGRSAFYDTGLNSVRTYMGTDWGRRTVAFSGYGLPMQADIAVHELMKVEQAANPERRDLLLALLEIDPEWRMHQVSDGMRRRVQIFLQLLSPYPIVLLDEITVDLDVITRSDFLDFLKRESEEGKVTILYATHIFAGLEDWWTHIAYISKGKLTRFGHPSEIADYQALLSAGQPSPLHKLVEDWIRADRVKKVLPAYSREGVASSASDSKLDVAM